MRRNGLFEGADTLNGSIERNGRQERSDCNSRFLSTTRRGWLAGAMMVAAGVVGAQTQVFLGSVGDGVGQDGFAIGGGTTSGDRAGTVSGVGDVNGDGLGDIAVGAEGWGSVNQGRVVVVFGKTTAGNTSFTTAAGGVGGFSITGDQANDGLHRVSAAGDLNGDGLADILVGAPYANPFALSNAGTAYVVFGKSDNTSGVQLSALGTQGFAILGEEAGALTGQDLSAAGDVNGDGVPDLLIGAPHKTVNGLLKAGRTYVVFGKSSTSAVNLSAISLGTGGFVVNGIGENDTQSVNGIIPIRVGSAGDFNGDGLSDILIGARYAESPVGQNTGRVWLVYGKTSTASVELTAVSFGTGGFPINGPGVDAYLTGASGVGDVNADGLSDIVVGAPNSNSNRGRAWVIFGKSDNTSITLPSIGTAGFSILGGPGDEFTTNWCTSAGDLNGDGLGDILLNGQQSDSYASEDSGRNYIVFGKSTTTDVELSSFPALGSGVGLVFWGREFNEQIGFPLSPVGDANGDGLPDVVFGSEVSAGLRGRSYVAFSPFTPPISATYRTNILANNAVRWGIGTHRFGVDATIFPDSRAWVDFAGGTGPGLLNSSSISITINRSKAGLVGLPANSTANVYWSFGTSNRNNNNARLTFRYTDAEIAGITEANLRIYGATSVNGPWTLLANPVVTSGRNEVSGDTTAITNQVFALSAGVPDATAPTANIQLVGSASTVNQAPEWTVTFSEDIGSSFTESDLQLTGSLAASAGVLSLTQTSPLVYSVRLATTTATASGSLGFTLAAGSVTDLSSNPVAASNSPMFSINEVVAGTLAGDVNKDGSINTADITTLGNFIVNGTPLP